MAISAQAPDNALQTGLKFRHQTLRGALAAMLHRDEPARISADLGNVSIAASGTKA